MAHAKSYKRRINTVNGGSLKCSVQHNKNKICAFVSLQINPPLCPILLLDRPFLVSSWLIEHF